MANKIFLRVGAWYKASAKLHPDDIELSELIDDVDARFPEVELEAAEGLPSQTGNSGKYLKTNGTAASWDTPTASLGYLVYTALLTNINENAPTELAFQNDLGGTSWLRSEAGAYSKLTTTDFDIDKIYINGGFAVKKDTVVSTEYKPIYNVTNSIIRGYYKVELADEGDGKITIFVTVINTDSEFTDLSEFDNPNFLYIPEIRVYP